MKEKRKEINLCVFITIKDAHEKKE